MTAGDRITKKVATADTKVPFNLLNPKRVERVADILTDLVLSPGGAGWDEIVAAEVLQSLINEGLVKRTDSGEDERYGADKGDGKLAEAQKFQKAIWEVFGLDIAHLTNAELRQLHKWVGSALDTGVRVSDLEPMDD